MHLKEKEIINILCVGFVNWFDALKYRPDERFVFLETDMDNIHKQIRKAGAVLCHMALTDVTVSSDMEKIDTIRLLTNAPVFIYNHGAAEDKVLKAFEHGITDYFSVNDNISICRKKLEICVSGYRLAHTNNINELKYKNMTLNRNDHQITIKGRKSLSLPPIEYSILEILMERTEQYIDDEQMFMKIWGHAPEDFVDLNKLAVHVSRLRGFLRQGGCNADMIRKVTKKGYILKEAC